MSFILDALRKSENERQRGAVPTITRAPLARPRQRAPVWSVVLIAMLALCVVVLAGAWWLTGTPGASQGPAQSAVQSQSQAQSPAQSLEHTPGAFEPVPRLAATGAGAPAAGQTAAAGSSGIARAADSSGAVAPPRTSPLETLAASRPTVSTPPPPPAAVAAETGAPRPQTDGSRSASAATDMPPTILELATQGITVPNLNLEMHMYGANPAQRFVFINGTRYREGETLSEGPQVVSIESDQVVLSYRGTRFRISTR